ncbi:hypothetical protein GCM10011415_27850 [Salipiger pallidus]|uniref:Uncharacterized protein n=1 Tax=Salipiger pallidus TaxID=1775170 RepID=A0A8J2ZL00_9RHOB|nr:hypothetical protein [Salipiger pallidus]GGG77397.1 hypothetical protein GCM10011415_27850 [Salipiger pallidus]
MVDLGTLQEFQTSIVGIIGFTGVILSQLLNGWLARRREISSEIRRRAAIMAALKAELSIFRDAFARPDADQLPQEGGICIVHVLERSATPDLMRDLGLLSDNILDRVLYALLTIDAVRPNASLYASEVSDTHLTFDRNTWPIYAKIVNNVAKQLDEVIELLDRERC